MVFNKKKSNISVYIIALHFIVNFFIRSHSKEYITQKMKTGDTNKYATIFKFRRRISIAAIANRNR